MKAWSNPGRGNDSNVVEIAAAGVRTKEEELLWKGRWQRSCGQHKAKYKNPLKDDNGLVRKPKQKAL